MVAMSQLGDVVIAMLARQVTQASEKGGTDWEDTTVRIRRIVRIGAKVAVVKTSI
jgi:hypothetical protein